MRCRNCGWENAPANVHCEKCGAPLAAAPSVPGFGFCTNCGYPLARSGAVCPNCGTPIPGRAPVPAPAPSPAPVAPQPAHSLAPAAQAAPGFTLEPVNSSLEENPAGKISYEGTSVALNRSNTEPGNPSITSKVQAEMIYKDGKWFVQDTSALQTTFIHVDGQVQVNDGSIILIGNRLFRFREKK